MGLGENDLVIDIGSNDGTLLTNFKINKIKTLGVEPSQAGNIANKNGDETIIDYFNDQTVKNFNKNKKPKLITATNVFAHIEDPSYINKFNKKNND